MDYEKIPDGVTIFPGSRTPPLKDVEAEIIPFPESTITSGVEIDAPDNSEILNALIEKNHAMQAGERMEYEKQFMMDSVLELVGMSGKYEPSELLTIGQEIGNALCKISGNDREKPKDISQKVSSTTSLMAGIIRGLSQCSKK